MMTDNASRGLLPFLASVLSFPQAMLTFMAPTAAWESGVGISQVSLTPCPAHSLCIIIQD